MTLPKLTGGGDYEILAVGARKIGMNKVTQDARRLNLPEEKLLGDRIVTIPGFTLEKYRKLQRSHLSIFSPHCFGGLISKMLGLPVRTPFGTNGVEPYGFIKFLREPQRYLNEKLTLNGKKSQSESVSKNTGNIYEESTFILHPNNQKPKLGDIAMTMVHYKTFDDFVEMWERRKPRINWYNIFVEMYTAKPDLLELFDALPYGKKICFVPFKSDLDSAWYINPEIDKEAKNDIHAMVIRFGWGTFFYYDVFDMLLYGKKTPLIEM